MKKIFNFIFAFILLTTTALSFVGCKSESKTGKIRLNEVTHSVFYAPLYVAINKGFMKDEGIEIELVNGGGSDASMSALL